MSETERLGKYQIISVLGQGAMGVVYQGYDPVIGRTVALKTIRKGVVAAQELEPLLSRLRHEAQAAGRLTHPGIVTVYDYGEEGDTAFIAMECVQGRDLAEVLDRGERLTQAAAIAIVNQLLDILAYSHAHGVVHRDIKPGNIILLADGRIKITDFGIAKIEASDLTQGGDVLGTPSYMSPEQYEGLPVDCRSDLFSAGVIFYHLLTGEKPFPGNSLVTIMHRVMHTIPAKVSELNGQLPTSLDPVLEKALAKKADDRYQSADEFSQAMNRACRGKDVVRGGVAAGAAFSRSPTVEATVALSAEEHRSAPPPNATPGPAELPLGGANPSRRWLFLAAGLVLLAIVVGWLGVRTLGHNPESRHEAAPTPAATPAPTGVGERTHSAVAAPAKSAPPAPTDHRRPTSSASSGQPSSARGEIARSPAKVIRKSQSTLPPEATHALVTEPSLPSDAAASAPTTEQVRSAATPAEISPAPVRPAIKGSPGLGRKLREDEW